MLWKIFVGDKRQVDRLFMDILRSNQNGNICVVSFHHGSKDPELAEEARQLGLEPRYVYRVTQVRGRRLEWREGWLDGRRIEKII